MEIKPVYVSFDQAKILKEKSFIEPCNSYFELALTSQENDQDGFTGPFGWRKGELNTHSDYFINNHKSTDLSSESWYMCARPEQWKVVGWLWETYAIDVSVIPIRFKGERTISFQYRVINFSDPEVEEVLFEHQYNMSFECFSTKHEAYSAAFDHILNILI